jgi:hypothetical protein
VLTSVSLEDTAVERVVYRYCKYTEQVTSEFIA